MPRIRTIKPEFWTDEKLSLLDPLTRLTFLGLISMADDAGRLVDNVKLLDGMLFPNTDDTCREALDTLARLSRITRYRSSSGQALIQITNWSEHQKVDKPSKAILPGPETAVVTQPPVPSAVNDARENGSREPRESLARVSRSDLGPTTVDHGPPTTDQRASASAAAVALSVRANQGLAEHATRPQLIAPIIGTSGKSLEAAEAILAAGVPLPFAEAAVYELARTHTSDRPVRSLRYFVDAVVRRWEQEQATTEAKREGKLKRRAPSQTREDADALAVARRLVAGNVDMRRADPDGAAWWQRMQREAKAAGKDPWLYGSERLKEPAERSA